jgi:hypothetical protein
MSKTLPGYETLLAIPAVEVNGVPWLVTPTGLVDFSAPTAAALNVWRAINKPSDLYGSNGGNISCAILDDINLGLTGSDTDSAKTICSKGSTEALTNYNFNAEVNGRLDEDPTADSLANLYRDIVRAPDVAYFLAHRVRGQKDSTEAFAIGDEVDLYYVHTDNPTIGYGDEEFETIGQAFIPKGVVNVGYTLTA